MAGFAQTLDPRLLAKVPKIFRPLYQQAYGETLLRYAPEQQSLLGLLGQTEGGYQQKVAQANAAADLIQNAALTQQRNLPAAYQAPGNPLMGLLGQRGVQAAEGAKYQITGAQGQRDTDLAKIDQSLGDLGTNAATYFSTRADQLVQGDRKSRHDTNAANRTIAAEFKRTQVGHGINPATGKYDPSLNRPDKPPAGPSTIAKPPSGFTGSPADWNAM